MWLFAFTCPSSRKMKGDMQRGWQVKRLPPVERLAASLSKRLCFPSPSLRSGPENTGREKQTNQPKHKALRESHFYQLWMTVRRVKLQRGGSWCCLWCAWQMQRWHLMFSHSLFSPSPAGGHWRQRKEKHLNAGFKPACLTPFINALTQSDLSLCDTSIILNGKSKYGGLQYSMADREHSLKLAKSGLNAADSWRGNRISFAGTSNLGKNDKYKIMASKIFWIIHSGRIRNGAWNYGT